MSSLWQKITSLGILSIIVVHASPTIPAAFQWSLPVLSPTSWYAYRYRNPAGMSPGWSYRDCIRKWYSVNDNDIMTGACFPSFRGYLSRSWGGCAVKDDTAESGEDGFKMSLSDRASAAFLLVATLAATSPPTAAATTGGRIGGGYTPQGNFPSVPPIQQQQPRQNSRSYYDGPARPGLDMGSGDDNRVHISYRGNGPGPRRLRHRAISISDIDGVPSNQVTTEDAAFIGIVTAGVLALQWYNEDRYRKRGEFNEGSPIAPGGGGFTSPDGTETATVTTFQVGLFCERRGGRGEVLETLKGLSKIADVTTREGLATLVSEVCLTLLRSEEDWVGAAGGIKQYTWRGRGGGRDRRSQATSPRASAKREFNRAVTRERSKVEYETVSITPNGVRSDTAAGKGISTQSTDGTYAVITLIIRWAGLRGAPLIQEPRRSLWFSQPQDRGQDKDILYSVESRQSAVDLLEYLGDEAAEGGGQNLLDVEVLWAPAEDDESLTKDYLYIKWPEFRYI